MEQVLAKVEKIVGKESMEKFYATLKENLAAAKKENEKKNVSFSVKGGEGEPAGVGLSIQSVNKDVYSQYITEEKDYMKDALTVLTVQIGLKNAEAGAILQGLFDQFKPMIDEIEFIKPYIASKKLEYYLRLSGTKACIDVIFKDEVAFNKLKEMGVDFSEYQSFKLAFKTGIKCNEVLYHKCLIKKIRGICISVCYNKLWKLLIDKKMMKTQLCKEAKISTNAVAKMGRDEDVRVEALAKICATLGCTMDDIIEVLSEQAAKGEVDEKTII